MALPLLFLAAAAAKPAASMGAYYIGGFGTVGASVAGVSWWQDWRWWNPEWWKAQKNSGSNIPVNPEQALNNPSNPSASTTVRVVESLIPPNIPIEVVPTAQPVAEAPAPSTVAASADEDHVTEERRVEQMADDVIIALNAKVAKLDKISLKKWITSELLSNKALSSIPCFTREINSQLLVDQLCHELQHSLLDDASRIPPSHLKELCQARVTVAFIDWLYSNKLTGLTPTARQIYELSIDIRDELTVLRKRKRDSKEGKQSFERLLIFNAILNHRDRDAILQQQKDIRKKFILSVAERKYDFEQNSSKASIGINYKGLSYDLQIMRNYEKLITQTIGDAQISVAPAVSFANANPAFFQPSSLSLYPIISMEGESMGLPNEYSFTPAQAHFVDFFSSAMEELYSKLHLLHTKVVQRIPDTTDKGAAMVAQAATIVPNFSVDGIPIPVGTLLHGLAWLIHVVHDRSEKEIAARMDRLLPANFERRVSMICTVARSLAFRYENQLQQLDIRGAEELARCAAARAVEYATRSEDNHYVAESTTAKVGAAIKRVGANKDAPYATRQRKDPRIVMLEGVHKGKSNELDTRPMAGSAWEPRHVFHNTGLIVRDSQGKLQHYTHDTLRTNQDSSPLYGYHYGSVAEIKRGDYKPDLRVPLEIALKGKNPWQAAIPAPSVPVYRK